MHSKPGGILMFERFIGWFGKRFMAGSGYEKRLHNELIRLRQEIEQTNHLLKNIKNELVNVKNTLGKSQK
jgi:uncharacterized protein (DUF342 family)